MKITLSTTRSIEHMPALLVFMEQGAAVEEQLKEQIALYPHIPLLLNEAKMQGKAGSGCAIPLIKGDSLKWLIITGLGERHKAIIPVENYRRALGKAIKLLQQHKIMSAAVYVPDASLFGQTKEYIIKQTAIIACMAAYRFDEYMSNPECKVPQDLTLEFILMPPAEELSKSLKEGMIIGKVVNKVRHWIDLPPAALTPIELADKAKQIADAHHLKITVYDEPEIKAMGMGGLAGVSAGSEQNCKLVILEYQGGGKGAPTLGFVGKGITFDSGGLSLKPAASMETMKDDMSGAAAVIGAMEIIAQLKPAVNVVALVPLSENLPSGTAIKPGDILRFYNGKTAEVRNTDAEGRLILADALSYAVKHYKLDALVDLATLTGACAYALGPFFSGLMSQYPALVERIQLAAESSGDRVWPLPFDNDYKKAIKSEVADICNIGNGKYKAGAITAGFFLSNFVEDVPWAHLDIAGTAFEVPDISYYSSGATGVGVRLLVDLALSWK